MFEEITTMTIFWVVFAGVFMFLLAYVVPRLFRYRKKCQVCKNNGSFNNDVYTCDDPTCNKQICEECFETEESWNTCDNCGYTFCSDKHFDAHECNTEDEDEEDTEESFVVSESTDGKFIIIENSLSNDKLVNKISKYINDGYTIVSVNDDSTAICMVKK